MWVDPEVVRLDGVPDSDVSASAFVVIAIDAQPANGGGVVAGLEVLACMWQ